MLRVGAVDKLHNGGRRHGLKLRSVNIGPFSEEAPTNGELRRGFSC